MNESPNVKPDEVEKAPRTTSLSAAEWNRLQQGYASALELMEQPAYDVDHVHDLLAECVIRDPGNVLYVDALLDNLDRKRDSDKQSSRSQVYTSKGTLEKAIAGQNWKQVLRLGPEFLKKNPRNIPALKAMAQACQANQYDRAEVRYLQNALDAEPNDIELNRRTAHLLAKLKRFDEAIACWRRVEDADRCDTEASCMIANLTLEKTRHQELSEEEGQQGDTENVALESAGAVEMAIQQARSNPGRPAEDQNEPRKLVLTRRQELEQAIINCPENEDTYLQLADLYLSEGRTYDAQRTLAKAHSVCDHPGILNRLEDVNMLRAEELVKIAEQQAAEEGTAEAREQVEKLRNEQASLEFEIFKSRCERTPDDNSLKFQLGVRLKRLGNFREAIDRLKAGLEVPEHRVVASLEIGEILQRYQQFPKALQCYRQAAQLASGDPTSEEHRKRALYRAGTLATTMRLTDSAEQYLGELVRMDADYLDTKPRLDKLTEMSENL